MGGAVVVCTIGAALGVSSLASATGASHHAKNGITVRRVFIRGNKNPHFVAPKSIHAHDKLKIINETDPNKIGPHTFSMVKQRFIPQTNKEIRSCGKKGHICREIAKWHGVKGNGPPTINPVDAGRHGWDREGTLSRKGDSWFTGNAPGAHFRQRVAGDAPHVITFMCAIHPFMHGSIVVKP